MSPVLIVILLSVALGVVRVWTYRRRGGSIISALGLSFDRMELANVAAGAAIGFFGIAATFVVAYLTKNIAVAGVGSTLGGITYGITFVATEALWLPFGLHFAWNYAQGPVFGFALSGGKPVRGTFVQQENVGPAWFTGGEYGPEGGAVGFVGRALVLALVLAWIAYRRGRFISLPAREA
ncbi:MAG: hypothetical protein NUW01_15290 [Gemmatimonadaceae bacterium]|nr:hypothetical protein [Gemmatimonadaceae bacterium]